MKDTVTITVNMIFKHALIVRVSIRIACSEWLKTTCSMRVRQARQLLFTAILLSMRSMMHHIQHVKFAYNRLKKYSVIIYKHNEIKTTGSIIAFNYLCKIRTIAMALLNLKWKVRLNSYH